jgi:hypothetical protein
MDRKDSSVFVRRPVDLALDLAGLVGFFDIFFSYKIPRTAAEYYFEFCNDHDRVICTSVGQQFVPSVSFAACQVAKTSETKVVFRFGRPQCRGAQRLHTLANLTKGK